MKKNEKTAESPCGAERYALPNRSSEMSEYNVTGDSLGNRGTSMNLVANGKTSAHGMSSPPPSNFVRKSFIVANTDLPRFYQLIKTHKTGPVIKIRHCTVYLAPIDQPRASHDCLPTPLSQMMPYFGESLDGV